MIASIPEGIKEISYSLTHLCYNLFGYLPAPILYGIICHITGGEKSRFGLALLMAVSCLGVLFLYWAAEEAKTATKDIDLVEDDLVHPNSKQINTFLNENDNYDASPMLPINRRLSSNEYKLETLSAFYGRPSLLSMKNASPKN